jgi:hypothetical protein
MNNYSPNINNPIKSVGSNINNNFNKYVNTPIKDISSKLAQGVSYNNASDYEYDYDYDYENSSSNSSLFKRILFWLAIILLLAFLGFNIFKYLAQGTDIITSLLSPFTYTIAYLTGETAKTTLKHTSQGTQTIVGESSSFLQIFLKFVTDLFNNTLTFITTNTTSAIDYLQSNIKKDKIIDVKPEKQINGLNNTQETTTTNTNTNTNTNDDEDDSTILNEERKIENRVQNVSNDIKKLIVQKEQKEPQPLQSDTQQNGYCYIGKINNARYCAKVSGKNNCLSGDIFPTMEVCVNPNLKT